MRILSLIIIIILFVSTIARTEEKAIRTGQIIGIAREAATREPVEGAQITVVGQPQGTVTDSAGRFQFELPPGTYSLRGTAFSYDPLLKSEIGILPNRRTQVELLFVEHVLEGAEVTVEAQFHEAPPQDQPTSSRTLSYEEVRRSPGAAEDVQRMIQALPGVSGQNDQNNEIVVRGGSPSENLTVLDGIEIDNINHFGYQGSSGGPISLLNPEYLRDVTFASGGFGAKYGDANSSVLDLDLREGSRTNYHGELEFSMAGTGGLLEGPLKRDKGALIVSARRSYLDFALADAIGLTAIPTYWDVQSKFSYDLTARHLLTLNGLFGQDKIRFDSDEPDAFSRGSESVDYRGDRTILGARLRSLWPHGYSDLVVSGVRGVVDVLVDDADRDSLNRLVKYPELSNRSVETVGQFSLHYNGEAWQHDTWAVGGAVKPVRMNHKVWFAEDTTVYRDGILGRTDGNPDTLYEPSYEISERRVSPKYYGFLQYTKRLRDNLAMTGGLRYDGFQYSGEHTLGPRASLLWDPHPRWTASLAYGWYYQAQPFWIYTSDPNGLNKELPHVRAIQYVAGLKFRPRESSLLSVEGYYKDYDKVTISEQDYVRETTGDDTYLSQKLLPERTRTAYGFEFFAQQKLAANWYGTLSYSLGKSENHDDAFGDTPADYDFRHVLAVVAGYKTSFIKHEGYKNFTKKWYGFPLRFLPINGDELQFSTRYRLMSGRPYNGLIWVEAGDNPYDTIYEPHWAKNGENNARYPNYERFDVRLDNKHYLGRTALIFFLEVQNVADRGNVAEYIFADSGSRDTLYQFRFFFVGGVRVEL